MLNGQSSTLVLKAANPWEGTKYQDRHIAERLAAQGVDVLYVEPPISHATPRRAPSTGQVLTEARLRSAAPGIDLLTPVVLPFPRRAGMSVLTRRAVAHRIKRALETRAAGRTAPGGRDIVVVDSDPLASVLGLLPARLQVYWAQDDFAGGAELLGQSAARLRRGDARAARQANTVIASSPVVAGRLRAEGHAPVLIPFGCDSATFARVDDAPAATDVRLPGPVVGFVGLLADRIDLSLLEAVAARGVSLLLVGALHPKFDEVRLAPLLSRPNVQWVGPRPFADLPSYLKRIDVGVVPYADTAFNRGSFPLKTLEYLAAGRAAVATSLPSTRWLDTPLIRLADTAADFADAVEDSLGELRTAGLVEARRRFARQHDWSDRATEFGRALGLLDPAEPVASA